MVLGRDIDRYTDKERKVRRRVDKDRWTDDSEARKRERNSSRKK